MRHRSRNRFLSELLYNNKDAIVTSFDKVFDNIVRDAFPQFSNELGCDFFSKASYPKVNILDFSTNISIEAAVPGLKKEDIIIKYDPETKALSISADKVEEEDSVDFSYIIRELKKSSFKRTFIVNSPENYDMSNISAKIEDGILKLYIPKVVVEKKEIVNIDIK